MTHANLSSASIDALMVRARREVDEGLLPSAQVAIAKDGKLIAKQTFGQATDESLYCVFSATKAITSGAIWLLLQEGKLRLDERVAEIIPEFAPNGKDAITVEQLLTHTGGFPSAPFRPSDWDVREKRLERFSRWRLNWPPGSRFEYHPTSGMWVLAEIIERRTGEDFRAFIKRRIAEPLGLNSMYVGMPETETARAALCVHVGQPATAEDYAALGLAVPEVGEVTEQALLSFNEADVRAVGVPGGGGFMGAGELALLYQALLHGGPVDGDVIWHEDTLVSARRIRTGSMLHPTHQVTANRGLGIIVAGDDGRAKRGFGLECSSDTFGHNGAGGQIAWVDPVSGLSLGYCTDGHDRNRLREQARTASISDAAAACA
ncbi:MAG: CubicO group peptidase (beta-lactamase class C family) [Gammaproteobacteria bacterium]|jgi:CubicO group peptidase (beta-lactamase class C family)